MTKTRIDSSFHLPGYSFDSDTDVIDSDAIRKKHEETDWINEFGRQKQNVTLLVNHMDHYNVLAAIASYCLSVTWSSKKNTEFMKFPFLELLQSVLLMGNGVGRSSTPLSVSGFTDLLNSCNSLFEAFVGMQVEKLGDKQDVSGIVIVRARLHTIYYRFKFDRDICLSLVDRISRKFDDGTNNQYQDEG